MRNVFLYYTLYHQVFSAFAITMNDMNDNKPTKMEIL